MYSLIKTKPGLLYLYAITVILLQYQCNIPIQIQWLTTIYIFVFLWHAGSLAVAYKLLVAACGL